jgi:dinuclear metal center YbgI/SA1388 family protein
MIVKEEVVLPKVSEIEQYLCELYPLALAESWDNVGLLIGRRSASVNKVMTCLTLSPDVADEASEQEVNLIVSHHPFPFKPSCKYTDATVEGRIFLKLVESGIAVFSSHTAFDGAAEGINELILKGLGLNMWEPIVPKDNLPGGMGRMAKGKLEVDGVIESLKKFFSEPQLSVVRGKPTIKKIGVVCGSGGDFVSTAFAKGVDCLITGEASFHNCLLARSLGMNLIVVGHFQSERFAMENLAKKIGSQFSDIFVFPSQRESNPITRV